ncbi:hypothetical protein AFL22_22340 [Pantoea sp. CFSAN033090]|nr:hypothetical protein AFL22_22340 [Pantoea sp. CFSAN033090]
MFSKFHSINDTRRFPLRDMHFDDVIIDFSIMRNKPGSIEMTMNFIFYFIPNGAVFYIGIF